VKRAIVWFRRDLRLTDHTALWRAHQEAEELVPVYVLSGWQQRHRWTGSHRQGFLCDSLRSLAENLRHLGGALVLRQGEAVEELGRLAYETGAEAIFFNRGTDPHGREVDRRLAESAGEIGVEVRDYKDVTIHERDEVLTAGGDPFRVFTPYARAWEKREKPPVAGRPREIRTPEGIRSLDLPTLKTWALPALEARLAGGERAARERMKKFLAGGIAHYAKARDFPAEEGTSRLSQDLRFGLLSPRELWRKCEESAAERTSARKFIGELIWREFYFSILWHFPEVLEMEFNPQFRGVKWPGKAADFARWRDGETGFPIVDAAMRQLNQTGYMHNRLRMIAAMFLTKDLHLDWRLGEQYFMQKLTDGEIASNNGGWQWSAGTGADAAPYFRIQNPWRQTERYDPEGLFIKRWLPELKDVRSRAFFAPPAVGSLAPGYPAPIVDHAQARDRTMDLFSAWKKGGR